MTRSQLRFLIWIGGFAILLFIVWLTCCERIDAGSVGLKVNMTGEDKGVSTIKQVSGWCWYVPGASKIVEIPVYVKHKDYEPLDVFARGGIKWQLHPSINYQVNSDQADKMYQKFRVSLESVEDGWMKNMVYQVARDAINTFDSDSLLNHREIFEAEMAKELSGKLSPYFVLSNVTSGVTPPAALTAAIEAKTRSIQEAQAADNNRLVAIKQGQANLAKAQFDSSVMVTNAKAEAQAISVKQEALRQSPTYVELIKAEKWNGQLPNVISGSSGGLFMNLNNKD